MQLREDGGELNSLKRTSAFFTDRKSGQEMNVLVVVSRGELPQFFAVSRHDANFKSQLTDR